MLRTRAPLSLGASSQIPSDLHVLGLPLAFILSQDQTLHCKMFSFVQTLLLKIEICIIMISFLFSVICCQPCDFQLLTLNLLANLRIFIQYPTSLSDFVFLKLINFLSIINPLRYMLYLKKRTFHFTSRLSFICLSSLR